jgi:multiple sugar transport system substrate-binding protein
MGRHNDRPTVQGTAYRLSRRAALRLLGGAGAAAFLAACGNTASPTTGAATTASSGGAAPTTGAATKAAGGAGLTGTAATSPLAPTATTAPVAAGTPTGSPAAAASPGTVSMEIQIANSGAKLPTDKVNFRWVDSGDQKAVFFKQYFELYQQAHPNITVGYDALPWNEIAKVVPLGVQSGNAHDVFQVPLNVPGPQAVTEGWVAPLDDLIPNFQEWKKAFPKGAFASGITDFNGKTYTIPLTSNQRYSTLILYNTAIMQQAGYDPGAKPLTWDEFRAAAKKVTQQGAGKYYGLIIGGNQTNQWSDFVGSLGRMAGAPGSGGDNVTNNIDYRTGEYTFTTAAYLGALDLLLALKGDGSIFPGSNALTAPQARSQMPQGAAGMILQGPWNVPQWKREAPDFKFGVGSQPVPNSGTPLPLSYGPGGSNLLWVYAKSPNKAIAADIFSYLGSEQGQTAWGTISDGADAPIFPSASQNAKLDPEAQQAQQLFIQQMRLRPDPAVRNPDVSKVDLELKTLTPNFGQVIQGLYTGQLKDAKAALKDLQDRSEAELQRAIKAAQAKGAKVSRDDWKFANWDPTKDFTEADYK